VRIEPYHAAPGFLYLHTKPCPYLRPSGHCDVYEVRPYNCRRFMCGRADPESDIFEEAPVPTIVLKTRALRRQYAKEQRHHQKWARAHGWSASA